MPKRDRHEIHLQLLEFHKHVVSIPSERGHDCELHKPNAEIREDGHEFTTYLTVVRLGLKK